MSRKKRAVSEDTAHITRQEANITLRSNIYELILRIMNWLYAMN